jgi:Carboxypeptidase regulatory-like domain
MKLWSPRRSLSLLALLAAFTSQAGWALAGTSGNIAGIVRDATTGAPIAGVRLQITSPAQAVATTTDAQGHFIALYLQPDDYSFTLEKAGYEKQSISGYTVFADQTVLYDFKLNPAATTPSG